ncbi:putative iron-regulated membrane protein [Algoriphagus sp. 4150]|uniref:PepSY-associated TM helix domain-containing protein n=1 Tax=Algoriphagus sp. 4150 TaxID=2817756 RepID=UPI002863EC1C|nr:PepSY-associated TM helix domain-containing protein [Algoriphagus sp. 4150]MDR7130316.1 putative iron-regulated membrane protein [Algoriphagus sp. 4150]
MSNRIYNILFHTHTISGIIISVALYVIFFAGSFSFFRDEIVSWERNESISEGWMLQEMDFDLVLDTLEARKGIAKTDVAFNQHYDEQRLGVTISAPKDAEVKEGERGRGRGGRGNFFYMNTQNLNTYDYQESYSFGEFLYRLHFFAQLNFFGRSGYMLAGIVAFFFLFAVITGVIVHWKKIISNFYIFRPNNSVKNLWTDAHTALGIIGLPYQFMFALTGVYVIVGLTVMSPAIINYIYDGDQEKAFSDFGFSPPKFEFVGKPLEGDFSVNELLAETKGKWPEFHVHNASIFNYGDEGMHVQFTGKSDYNKKFASAGTITYRMLDREIITEKSPFQDVSYLDGARAVILRLHFGDFGGKGLKLVYFALGLLTCFVIISGVMIWLVARDKKHVSPAKRKFNAWLVWFYLAGCLSMFPVTAFTFVMIKVGLQDPGADRMGFIFQTFFWSWLALTLIFTFIRSNAITNKFTLILGGIIGLAIPVVSGLISGNWLWVTLKNGQSDIFLIDALWLVISVSAIMIGAKMKTKNIDPEPVKQPVSRRKSAVAVG